MLMLPLLETQFRVFDPASATNAPPSAARTPYGLASCSWCGMFAVKLKSNSPTDATDFQVPLRDTEIRWPACASAPAFTAAQSAGIVESQVSDSKPCGNSPRIPRVL